MITLSPRLIILIKSSTIDKQKKKSSKFFSTIVNVLNKLIHMLQMISVPPILFLILLLFSCIQFFLSSLIYRVLNTELTGGTIIRTYTRTTIISAVFFCPHTHMHRLLSASLISISLFYLSSIREKKRETSLFKRNHLHFYDCIYLR